MRAQPTPAPDPSVDEAVTAHVARLFFRDQLTKVEIAQRLGISRFRVARLIDESLSSGLVTISFRESMVLDAELGAALEEQYALDLCVVVRGCDADAGDDIRQLGMIAATFLDEMIVPNSVIGVSWGATTSAVVEHLPRHAVKGVKVVQLCGGSSRVPRDSEPLEVARRLSERVDANYFPVLAPALIRSSSARDELLSHEDIRASIVLWDALDLAVTGVGSYKPVGGRPRAALVASGMRNAKDVADLTSKGAIGELLVYPIRADGSLVPVDPPPIAASFDQLKHAKHVMVVAGGRSKGAAVGAALRTGVVSILITDDAAARTLVQR